MKLDPGFHPAARSELIAEVMHLNDERPGLGDEFERALDTVIEMIAMWPHAGALWSDPASSVEVRSLGVGRSPFRVFYVNRGTPLR